MYQSSPASVFFRALALCGAFVVAGNCFGAPASAEAKTDNVFTAHKVKDFEGNEQPLRRYVLKKGDFENDKPAAITDVSPGVFRFSLRFRKGDWWDADRATKSKDRQRAEVKGLGPHPAPGETFEYSTTWRTGDSFRCGGKFCHVFQLKALDGDNGAPLVVLTVMPDNKHAAVRYCSGKDSGFTIARQFPWTAGKWQSVSIRIKTSSKNSDKSLDGELLVSVDGDEFQGKSGIALYRPEADSYRPKWGLYRGLTPTMDVGDDWVEHKDVSARKVSK